MDKEKSTRFMLKVVGDVATALLAYRVQRVFQQLGEIGFTDHAPVRQHEDAVQETRHQGHRIGLKQAPGRMLAAQGFKGVDVQNHGPIVGQHRLALRWGEETEVSFLSSDRRGRLRCAVACRILLRWRGRGSRAQALCRLRG